MDLDTFIQEGFKKIKTLIKEKNYVDAMRGCEELLKIAPGEGKALKLYRKARDKIVEENIKLIDKKIEELEPLWEKEAYSELVDAYIQLIEYTPEYRKLHKLVEKAQKKLIAQRTAEKDEIISYYTKNINDALKQKQFDRAREFTKEFKAKAPSLKITTVLKQKVEDEYVKLELEKSHSILKSEKYEEILLIYERLLEHAPWDKNLIKALQDAQRDFIYHQQDMELRMVKSGTLRIQILYNLGKYEECLQECKIALRINNKSKFAQDYFKKAKSKLKTICDKKVIEIVKSAFAALKPTYEANKSAFTKI